MSSKIDTAQVETCIASKMFDHFYREGKKNGGEVIHSKDCFIECVSCWFLFRFLSVQPSRHMAS